MAELKTRVTRASVPAFLKAIPDDRIREDCRAIAKIMEAATGAKAKMWGPSIVGFGSYHYTYASGREGDWMLTGFSPRRKNITLYIMAGFDRYDDLLARLGTFTTGKSCLYIKQLSDVHVPTLKKLVASSVAHMKKARTP